MKTSILCKAQVIKPKSDTFKTIAASIKGKYGFELKPQMDLLYLESCLVSAGSKAGVNENDDIFTREEVWAARHTPVLKPFNWQHKDKDIVGIIYTVQARDLNGNVLDINQDAVPDCEFDLWTEAAIFRLIHPERSREIEERSQANNLFVSMEAWFDDYGYGLCSKSGLSKVVDRNESTAFLDQYLRAAGGVGKYNDSDSGQEMRIGRVLRSITFGGCGLVDHPANKRSVITSVEGFQNFNKQDEIELLLQTLLESEGSPSQELELMNAQANIKPDMNEVKDVLITVLNEREQVAAKAAAEQELKSRAATAEATNEELEAKQVALTEALQAKEAELQTMNVATTAYNDAVRTLITEQMTAAGVQNIPAEIAKIDAAKTGAEAFAAKIAWIQNSLAGLRSRAAIATDLETKLAEAQSVVREQDVRALFGDLMSEEVVDAFVAHASSLNDNEYSHWRDEKELMVIEIARSAKKEEECAEDEAEMPFPPKKKKEAKASNPFQALLQKYHSESQADADTSKVTNGDPLVNHPGGDGIHSGVNPGSLRTPRYKIAGSTAVNDPAKALENAKPKSGVSLAGAKQAGNDGEGENPFKTLANLVVSSLEQEDEDETESESSGKGFNPVQ